MNREASAKAALEGLAPSRLAQSVGTKVRLCQNARWASPDGAGPSSTRSFAQPPPLPRRLDHEKLWLTVGLASAGLGALWLRSGLATPPCLFHALAGCPCPGCGSTRAAKQLLDGHLAAALAFNPLTTLALLSAATYLLYAAGVVLRVWPRWRPHSTKPWPLLLRVAAVAALAGNWLWVVQRGL